MNTTGVLLGYSSGAGANRAALSFNAAQVCVHVIPNSVPSEHGASTRRVYSA